MQGPPAIEEIIERIAVIETDVAGVKSDMALMKNRLEPVEKTAEQVEDIFQFVQKARRVSAWIGRWAIRVLKALPPTGAGVLFLYGLVQGWF